MNQAKLLLDEGNLTGAVEAALANVKANPTDIPARIFLFELSCFSGDWERAARQLDVGFAARNGLVGTPDVAGTVDPARGLDTYHRVAEAMRTLPGVDAAAVGQRLPLASTDRSDRTVDVEGYTPAAGEEMTTYDAAIGPR